MPTWILELWDWILWNTVGRIRWHMMNELEQAEEVESLIATVLLVGDLTPESRNKLTEVGSALSEAITDMKLGEPHENL